MALEYTYRDVIIVILIACICIMFYVYVLRKTQICCHYCGAVTGSDGTTMKPPTTAPVTPTTTEGFAPVNTKLEALGPMDTRTLGALPLATGEKNHPQAGANEFLIDDTALGGAN